MSISYLCNAVYLWMTVLPSHKDIQDDGGVNADSAVRREEKKRSCHGDVENKDGGAVNSRTRRQPCLTVNRDFQLPRESHLVLKTRLSSTSAVWYNITWKDHPERTPTKGFLDSAHVDYLQRRYKV